MDYWDKKASEDAYVDAVKELNAWLKNASEGDRDKWFADFTDMTSLSREDAIKMITKQMEA